MHFEHKNLAFLRRIKILQATEIMASHPDNNACMTKQTLHSPKVYIMLPPESEKFSSKTI